jgi:hypothetical protein
MSKYWQKGKGLQMSDFKPLKRLHPDISQAPKDKIILGQIAGSYRCVAVKWQEKDQAFHACGLAGDPAVEIIAWITLSEWADVQFCMWRKG